MGALRIQNTELVEATCDNSGETVPLKPAPRNSELHNYDRAVKNSKMEYEGKRYCPYCNIEHSFRIPLGEKTLKTVDGDIGAVHQIAFIHPIESMEEMESRRFEKEARCLARSNDKKDLVKALAILEEAEETFIKFKRPVDSDRISLEKTGILNRLREAT